MKDRLIAAGIHLAISLVVASLILILLFVIWFPSPLMGLGAVQGVQIMLLVDLAIGPLLTLIVFKRGKRTLIMDLSVIAILQIAALGYGLTTVYGQAPSYMVLTYDGFYVVSRHEVNTLLAQAEFSIPEDLQEQPIKFAGKIPVYQLTESDNSIARSAQNNGFMFNQLLPYYLNVPKYQAFLDLDYLVNEGVATPVASEGCIELMIISPHGETTACLSLEAGRLVAI